MDPSIITPGENVVIITKRAFPEDVRRHFIGRVVGVAGTVVRVEGHAWIAGSVGQFERRPEVRTRVFSLSYGGEILFVVPPAVDIQKLRYQSAPGRLFIMDGADFSLDISEFGVGR